MPSKKSAEKDVAKPSAGKKSSDANAADAPAAAAAAVAAAAESKTQQQGTDMLTKDEIVEEMNKLLKAQFESAGPEFGKSGDDDLASAVLGEGLDLEMMEDEAAGERDEEEEEDEEFTLRVPRAKIPEMYRDRCAVLIFDSKYEDLINNVGDELPLDDDQAGQFGFSITGTTSWGVAMAYTYGNLVRKLSQKATTIKTDEDRVKLFLRACALFVLSFGNPLGHHWMNDNDDQELVPGPMKQLRRFIAKNLDEHGADCVKKLGIATCSIAPLRAALAREERIVQQILDGEF